MRAESERMVGVETGGVLVGFVDTTLDAVVVTGASGPGPKALHAPNSFNRDRAFCQAYLDAQVQASRGLIDFVGEWHKHREPDPWPSPIDVDTYTRLAVDPKCHLNQVVVLITGTMPEGRLWRRRDAYVRTNAFIVTAGPCCPRKIEMLPDEAYLHLAIHPNH